MAECFADVRVVLYQSDGTVSMPKSCAGCIRRLIMINTESEYSTMTESRIQRVSTLGRARARPPGSPGRRGPPGRALRAAPTKSRQCTPNLSTSSNFFLRTSTSTYPHLNFPRYSAVSTLASNMASNSSNKPAIQGMSYVRPQAVIRIVPLLTRELVVSTSSQDRRTLGT